MMKVVNDRKDKCITKQNKTKRKRVTMTILYCIERGGGGKVIGVKLRESFCF